MEMSSRNQLKRVWFHFQLKKVSILKFFIPFSTGSNRYRLCGSFKFTFANFANLFSISKAQRLTTSEARQYCDRFSQLILEKRMSWLRNQDYCLKQTCIRFFDCLNCDWCKNAIWKQGDYLFHFQPIVFVLSQSHFDLDHARFLKFLVVVKILQFPVDVYRI